MSISACRTKELDISTMLRPVFPPPLLSAGLAFCFQLIGWSLPFSLTVWTLTCQKKMRTTLTMSFLFPLATQILAWLWKSLTEPFVLGSWGERDTQSEREKEREKRREEGGKGDTTATICSMWPSLFSIRAAIHGMVSLITAHNTFSGMEHNLPVTRWTSRVASGCVHAYIYVCLCVGEFVSPHTLCKLTSLSVHA